MIHKSQGHLPALNGSLIVENSHQKQCISRDGNSPEAIWRKPEKVIPETVLNGKSVWRYKDLLHPKVIVVKLHGSEGNVLKDRPEANLWSGVKLHGSEGKSYALSVNSILCSGMKLHGSEGYSRNSTPFIDLWSSVKVHGFEGTAIKESLDFFLWSGMKLHGSEGLYTGLGLSKSLWSGVK